MVNNSKKDMTSQYKNSTVNIRVGCPPNWKIEMMVLQCRHVGRRD